jgi:LPS-assembly protein
MVQAEQINFDNDLNEGVAQDGVLRFMNVPLLPIPSFSFPLSATRKSGWLPPAFAIDNKGGVEASIPYYVNLAPNRDLTVTTTSMAKRGTRFDTEFRYLERKIPNPPFDGVAKLNVMPYDSLRGNYRWGYSHQHNGWADANQPIGFGSDQLLHKLRVFTYRHLQFHVGFERCGYVVHRFISNHCSLILG